MTNETEHNRWDEDHTKVCEDCYADLQDALYDMARDAELDMILAEAL